MCLYRPGHEHAYVWFLVTGAQRPHLGAWGNACYPLRDALQRGHSVISHLCDCAPGFASHDLSGPRLLQVQKRALARGQWLVHVGISVPPPEERVCLPVPAKLAQVWHRSSPDFVITFVSQL